MQQAASQQQQQQHQMQQQQQMTQMQQGQTQRQREQTPQAGQNMLNPAAAEFNPEAPSQAQAQQLSQQHSNQTVIGISPNGQLVVMQLPGQQRFQQQPQQAQYQQ